MEFQGITHENFTYESEKQVLEAMADSLTFDNESVTATGSDQAGAFQLTKKVSSVTHGSANLGVKLKEIPVGEEHEIHLLSAQALKIYPQTGGKIRAFATEGATNAAQSVTGPAVVSIRRMSTTLWAFTNKYLPLA
jgi:hypothetical protein